jgi:hypothetical protein
MIIQAQITVLEDGFNIADRSRARALAGMVRSTDKFRRSRLFECP